MSLLAWLPLFIISSLSECATQIFLKKGAMASESHNGLNYYLQLLKNKWTLSGIAVYFIDMVVWVLLLANIPLSIAFPMSGLQKILIVIFTAFILREKVYALEWFAIFLVALGIMIIIKYAS